jgi:hypothetical protein
MTFQFLMILRVQSRQRRRRLMKGLLLLLFDEEMFVDVSSRDEDSLVWEVERRRRRKKKEEERQRWRGWSEEGGLLSMMFENISKVNKCWNRIKWKWWTESPAEGGGEREWEKVVRKGRVTHHRDHQKDTELFSLIWWLARGPVCISLCWQVSE